MLLWGLHKGASRGRERGSERKTDHGVKYTGINGLEALWRSSVCGVRGLFSDSSALLCVLLSAVVVIVVVVDVALAVVALRRVQLMKVSRLYQVKRQTNKDG